MNPIRSSVGVITLFEEDLDQAKEFYTRVFGTAPNFADQESVNFKFENTFVNLERVPSVPPRDIISPVPVADRDAGSRVVLGLWVDDVDAVCADLAEGGVPLINGPIDRPWGVRTACFADPGGHIWEIGQDLD